MFHLSPLSSLLRNFCLFLNKLLLLIVRLYLQSLDLLLSSFDLVRSRRISRFVLSDSFLHLIIRLLNSPFLFLKLFGLFLEDYVFRFLLLEFRFEVVFDLLIGAFERLDHFFQLL